MYQALYRKYRPKTFDEVVGQKSVTDTLKAQLLTGHLSHAYLFTGTRGTGKTSCAKILAKAVNCLDPIDGSPCNRCAICKAIEAGACTDVQEIDAASNNGVDHVRALRDDAVYTPAEAKKRVYIIDEVHMLSMQAFNALLKTIEEPPEHLLFILATTELHKVPATILSRCQRFSFRRLLPEDIAGRIRYVAYQEQISIDDGAVQLLSHLADGALRDGMSLLDQCASAGGGTITAETVERCLGLAGTRKAAQLLEAVSRRDARAALEEFAALYAGGKDLAALLDEMACLARDILIVKTAPGGGLGMLSGVSETSQVLQLQNAFAEAELLRIIALLQQTAANFCKSQNPRVDCELCLLQLCLPQLQLDAQSLNARLSRVEEQLASGVLVQASPAAAPEAADAPPTEGPVHETAPAASSSAAGQTLPEEVTSEEDTPLPDGFWPELCQRMRAELRPPVVGFFTGAENAPLQPRLRGDALQLVANDAFVKAIVDKPAVRELVQTKAATLLGRPVAVQVVIKGQKGDSRALEELISFGQAHSDIFSIHEE